MEQQDQSEHQRKVVEMQKYLPCLDIIIERLKTMVGSTEKVLKMELLQQVLLGNEPVDSVKLDELEKYETTLMEIYNDSNDNENEQTDNSMDANDTVSDDEITESVHKIVEDPSTVESDKENNMPGTTTEAQIDATTKNVKSDGISNNEILHKTTESNASIIVTSQVPSEAAIENISEDTSSNSEIITKAVTPVTNEITENIEDFKDTSAATTPQSAENFELNKNEMSVLDEAANANETTVTKCDDPLMSDDLTKEVNQKLTPLTEKSDNIHLKDINITDDFETQNIDEAGIDAENDGVNVEYVDESEENVELIKVPEETADEEMILPDSADESEQLTQDSEENKLTDVEEIRSEHDHQHHSDINIDNEDAQHAPETLNQYDAEKVNGPSTTNRIAEANASAEATNNGKCTPKISEESSPTVTDNNDALTFGEKVAATITSQQDDVSRESSRARTTDSNGENTSIAADDEDDTTVSGDCNAQSEKDKDTDAATPDAAAGDNVDAFNDESTISVITSEAVDDDDDDVEIIEMRDSPICILSDDDENDNATDTNFKNIKNPLQTVVVVECTPSTVSRVFARKSTAHSSHRKSKRQSVAAATPQQDVIELLDSSDDDANTGLVNKRKRRLLHDERESGDRTFKRLQPKRTLLPPNQKSWTGYAKIKVLTNPLPSGAMDCRTVSYRKKALKSTPMPSIHKTTPQTNFLNAINLQPTGDGENPPAFCATISNKSIIIPNAFYGNPNRTETSTAAVGSSETVQSIRERKKMPPTVTTAPARMGTKTMTIPTNLSAATTTLTTRQPQKHLQRVTAERRVYQRWLDNFLTQFTKPRQLATHSCFVLLQRVLKYKVFTRIKDMRTRLNTMAYTSGGHIDTQLYQELQEIFFRGSQLTDDGLRFCQAACAQNGSNNVTLTTDAHTGAVTARTCSITELLKDDYLLKYDLMDIDRTTEEINYTNAERKRANDDVEYTPGKQYADITAGNTLGTRRKSLRKQRSRCYDERFIYEEADMVETTEEIERKQAEAEVLRKVEEKRLEAQRQREQQVKSFENAYIQMFSKSMKRKSAAANNTNANCYAINEPSSSRTSLTVDEYDSVEALDEEPKQHRIYKVIPTRLVAAHSFEEAVPTTKNTLKPHANHDTPEVITCDALENESCDSMSELVPMNNKRRPVSSVNDLPKNTNIHLHPLHMRADMCIICNTRATRTVDHYVNQHRNAEVYISRLPKARVDRLRRNRGNLGQESFYKTGQPQYEAVCAFCNRTKRFLLPYWQQHYAMHTGEYAYRCSGCGIRKPTRSPLTSHVNRPCPKRGVVLQDYFYSAKAKQIEARVCTLCNYTQLYRRNVLQHLRTQHNLKQIMPHHIETVVLLATPQAAEASNEQQMVANSYVANDNEEADDGNQTPIPFDYDDYTGAQAGQWDETDATDDLSYMICGMLDVQVDEH